MRRIQHSLVLLIDAHKAKGAEGWDMEQGMSSHHEQHPAARNPLIRLLSVSLTLESARGHEHHTALSITLSITPLNPLLPLIVASLIVTASLG